MCFFERQTASAARENLSEGIEDLVNPALINQEPLISLLRTQLLFVAARIMLPGIKRLLRCSKSCECFAEAGFTGTLDSGRGRWTMREFLRHRESARLSNHAISSP